MWNTNSNGIAVEQTTIVKCNATETDITGITGLALIEKLKKIARDNQIGKLLLLNHIYHNLLYLNMMLHNLK